MNLVRYHTHTHTRITHTFCIRQKTHLMPVTGSDQAWIKENQILWIQPRTIFPFSKTQEREGADRRELDRKNCWFFLFLEETPNVYRTLNWIVSFRAKATWGAQVLCPSGPFVILLLQRRCISKARARQGVAVDNYLPRKQESFRVLDAHDCSSRREWASEATLKLEA